HLCIDFVRGKNILNIQIVSCKWCWIMTSIDKDLAKKIDQQVRKEVGFLLKNFIVEIRVGEIPSKALIHNYTVEIIKLMETFFPNKFSTD
ncbi:hypothetical protein, partial [Leptospira ellisii]|uniref:hypothetical protein n=1 Tax=Leptospira ellisii TaxID=2023197 RepID=UPI001FAE9896